MKKTLLIVSLFMILSVSAFSQAMINIDSVTTKPANPTANDPVYLHIYGWCGYGAALNGPPTVLTAGNNHNVTACYIVNVLTVITDIHDSVYVFTGPAGVHTILWNIQQNTDQFTSVCDTLVETGTETVNVLTTSIDQNAQDPFAVYWNTEDHAFIYALPGKTGKTFSVYSVSGQLIAKEKIGAENGKLVLPAETTGLFIIALEDENGVLSRKKIYCH